MIKLLLIFLPLVLLSACAKPPANNEPATVLAPIDDAPLNCDNYYDAGRYEGHEAGYREGFESGYNHAIVVLADEDDKPGKGPKPKKDKDENL